MQSSLAKSLYIGLAALSLGAVATVSTTAQAASKAKVVSSKTLTTDATKRNVQATGKNALYSKPGTVKGAKTVASTKTMKKLASSKKSTDYFRAYYQKVTNKGSVYYKVVSMNGKYRGYIYGGKKAGTFAGGIKKASTMTPADMPATKTVYFAKPGTGNVTWNAPKYTQYKASKSVKNTVPFAKDTLTVKDAATKTREGSLYYYVEDADNPTVSGWIYAGAVTTTKPAADTFNDKTDIKVNLNTQNGTTIKSTVLTGLKDNTTKKVATVKGSSVGDDAATVTKGNWGTDLLKGTGYTYTATDSTNVSALASAKTGDTINLIVTKNADAATKVDFYTLHSDQIVGATKLTAYKSGDTVTYSSVAFPSVSAKFSGAADASYTASDLQAYLTTNGLTTLYTPSFTLNGKKVYMKYTFNNAVAGNYSEKTNAKAFYNATQMDGVSPVDTTTTTVDNGYVG